MAATNTKLQFLYGLSSNLPEAISNGNIYVTTDEQIMYVDIGGKRLRLSDFIWVENRDALPTPPPPDQAKGLWYIANENILAYYNGTSKTWVQINSHPGLKQLVTANSTVLSDATNGALIKLTASSADGQDAFPNFKFEIVSGNTATTKVALKDGKVSVTSADTIKTTGVSVSKDNNANRANITFTETTSGYDAAGVAITPTTTETDTVSITGSGMTVTQTGNDITLNAVPEEVALAFDSSGVLKASVKMPDGVKNKTSTGITPTVKVGVGSTKAQATFVNGVADLSGVYTAAETDAKITEKLKVANAMVFKGAVGGETALPASVEHGATYIVNKAGPVKDAAGNSVKTSEGAVIQMKVGDMLIASGTEGANGLVTNITWNYVPSGDDAEITTKIAVATNSMVFSQSYGGQLSTLGTLAIGDGLTSTVAGTTLTVAHKVPANYEAGANGTPATANGTVGGGVVKITAISGLKRDSYGHVIGFTTTTYSIPDESIGSYTNTVTATNNVATVTSKIVHNSNSSKTASFKIATSGNSAVKVEKGTDNTVNIDLYWSSF